MVFFSCDGCGEMLKKSQVDGHANRCRNCYAVSCVDCNVSFPGDEYRVHTSCVTEVERYEKRGPDKKKGKVTPQQAWMDLIAESVEKAPAHLKHYLNIMVNLDNVPRKEKPFRNFTSNSLGLRGKNNADTIVAEIWEHLKGLREEQLKARAAAKPPPAPKKEVTKAPQDDSSSCSSSDDEDEAKKEPAKAEPKPVVEHHEPKTDAKSVKKAMKKVLKKTKDRSLSVKNLRKAVLQHLGMPKSDKSALKKLVKQNLKDHKKQTFVVDGKKVTLQIE